jgi:osmoprotectant transport system permease protein
VGEGEGVVNVISWFTDPANWSGPNGIPTRTLQHILISAAAMIIALAVALPVGLILGHARRGTFLATNVGNVGRAVPTLGVLIIFASITAIGVGDLAAILALALFAIPPLLTNTFTGIAGVDDEVRDAARGMGMGGAAVLWRVEVPLALPLLAAGVRTATVQVVATASLAAVVGSGGLGRYVVDGFALQDSTLIVAGAILTAAISLAAEGFMAVVQRVVTPRGIRSASLTDQPAMDAPA